MFVVTLFSAVSATTNPNWGKFEEGLCTNINGTPDENKTCLDKIGDRWTGYKWDSKTCEELIQKTSEGADNKWCLSNSEYSLEAPTCCGLSCPGAKCTEVGGLSEKYVAQIEETACTAEAEDTTCSDLSEEINNLTKRTVELVCESEKCAPKAGQKPDDTKPKPDDTKPKPDGPTKPAKGNAFAMGLSTLAGALVILQL